ncbi:hypothetical protein EVAR_92253_1 [Eumeta japonica]|uniref:Uncharacterized protein n=1 Tax=Eumeta variegata TaxID=151549 RepID=A0A4C1TMH1_EUMVA|nr:hypothetical protein EVAR_92253_1 [Eumeta japonica]
MIMNREVDVQDMSFIFDWFYGVTEYFIKYETVQNLINDHDQTFDLAIIEWLFIELSAGFAPLFQCPLIWSSSVDPHWMVLQLVDEAANPAYVADSMSNNAPPFTFLERVEELWTQMKITVLMKRTATVSTSPRCANCKTSKHKVSASLSFLAIPIQAQKAIANQRKWCYSCLDFVTLPNVGLQRLCIAISTVGTVSVSLTLVMSKAALLRTRLTILMLKLNGAASFIRLLNYMLTYRLRYEFATDEVEVRDT